MTVSTSVSGNATQKQINNQRSSEGRVLMRLAVACLLFMSGGSLLSGCARGVTNTTVRANGSWVRKVAFHGSKPNKEGGNFGTTISEAFLLPTGAGWKTTHEDTNDEAVTVVERTLEAGETLHGDITVKGGKKQPMPIVVNDVTVQKVAPGVFKYTETIHWKGPMPKNLTPDADVIATFKKALPPTLATDENARSLATQITHDLWRVMFGPGDPLVSEFSALLSHPELVERHVQKRIGATLEQRLNAQFGAKMTPAERRETTLHIIHNALTNMSNQTKSIAPGSAKPGNEEDTTPGASLFISVKMPGRITEANGERDDLSGEVFWALYPEAAVLGDVTLTATCNANAQSASR